MTLSDYLRQPFFADCQRISLIGPFFDGEAVTTEPIIYVDGGSKFRESNQGFSVGDGDSSLQLLDEELIAEKDYSDLAYVFSVIPDHFTDIQLNGFLGGRRDHEIINLGEAHHFLKTRPRPTTLCFNNQVRAFSAGEWQITIQGTFSCIVIEPSQVALSGACKYQSHGGKVWLPLNSFGLSNEGSGTIKAKNSGPLFIFLADEALTV
ncbi:MAG: hypothetical protein GY821_10975 [Gammaproteobacteria bacterium]|nr:hypothetical protein [Gammaproteobacteria bacterium]